MNKELRNELFELIQDWRAWATTASISLPGIVAFILTVQGSPRVLFLGVCVFVLLFDISASLYILFTKKKDKGVFVPTPTGGHKETLPAKYRLLQPYAKGGLAFSALAFAILTLVPPVNRPLIDVVWGTRTPTPTQTATPTPTLTVTPSPTMTLTPSPQPISDFLYYMIVIDASEKMKESFHGQSKWELAVNALIQIINGLNPRAQFGLVMIGGSNSPAGLNDCQEPTSPEIDFSAREEIWNYIVNVQPQGGGSFYKAFTLAKTRLEGLSRDKFRTLIYITGSSDTCATEDEWDALKNIIQIPDTTVGLFSQIIILDEDGLRSQTLADRLNSLSENVNAQAPQTIQDLQGGATIINVVNNIKIYIEREVEVRATGVSPVATPVLISTSTPPSGITVPPPAIFTSTIAPSKTPKPTLTSTPTLPLSPTPSVVLLSASYIGAGEGCYALITSQVSGSPATGEFHVWNAYYGSGSSVYETTTLPVGSSNYRVRLGGKENPEYYRHEVWFEYNGISSNVLGEDGNLICPGLTPSP